MSYRIVAMTPEYLSSLRTTLDIVLKESLMFVFAEAPPMSEVTKFVTDIITHGDVQVIAVDGSQVIGWCDIVTTKRPTQRHCGAVGLGVLSGYRHQGVGGALLTQALERAKARGLTRIELFVRTDNAQAIRLYERHAFATEGLLRHHVRIGDTYRDSYLMSLVWDT